MSATRVIVTGGSGFMGSHIMRKLVEGGYRVLNFSLKTPAAEAAWWLRPVAGETEFEPGSIEDSERVNQVVARFQPEILIHLAAVVEPARLNLDPKLAFRVNTQGTFTVLEAARLYGVRRFVFASSIGVLPSIQYQPVDANHPIILATQGPGASFYAAAKVSGEAFCWAYHQAFGLDFITIRPSAVYGLGQQYPIYIKPMVENSVEGRPTRFETGGDFPRDYTHVEDVAQIFCQAAAIPTSEVHDRVFYAATGRPLVTASQVAALVRALIPGADIEIGSGLSPTDQIEIRYRGQLSIANASQQLGYAPRFADIRSGLADYVDQYRSYRAESAAGYDI
jgi:UDP-glucose 4-epimerase